MNRERYWDTIEKFKREVTTLKFDDAESGTAIIEQYHKNGMEGIDEEEIGRFCKTHWIGKNLWCGKCRFFGDGGICQSYAERHGARDINEILMKKETEEER